MSEPTIGRLLSDGFPLIEASVRDMATKAVTRGIEALQQGKYRSAWEFEKKYSAPVYLAARRALGKNENAANTLENQIDERIVYLKGSFLAQVRTKVWALTSNYEDVASTDFSPLGPFSFSVTYHLSSGERFTMICTLKVGDPLAATHKWHLKFTDCHMIQYGAVTQVMSPNYTMLARLALNRKKTA